MKAFKNPRAVEFDFKDRTYRVEPDFYRMTCKWWRVGQKKPTYGCEMVNPAYQIIAPDEDWITVSSFGIYLGSEDIKEIAQFMKLLNRAVRKFLPKGHPVWCKEVSSGYKAFIRSPEYLEREIY